MKEGQAYSSCALSGQPSCAISAHSEETPNLSGKWALLPLSSSCMLLLLHGIVCVIPARWLWRSRLHRDQSSEAKPQPECRHRPRWYCRASLDLPRRLRSADHSMTTRPSKRSSASRFPHGGQDVPFSLSLLREGYYSDQPQQP